MPCPGGPSLPPVVSQFFEKTFGMIHHSLVPSRSISMWEFPGNFSKSGNASVFYFSLICWSPWPADMLNPFSSLMPLGGRKKAGATAGSRFFFLLLLSPKGFKEVAELFLSRDLACCSVLPDFRLFLPGCPGAGSNTCHHMQYGHNTLIPTGSRTQQKKAQAEDQTWTEQKTEELLLSSVSGTKNEHKGRDRVGG